MKGTKIGLALSGGGSRAIAFHLGCLRALSELGLLNDVKAISTVSGGSIIGALYAIHQGPFTEFDIKVRQLLTKGLLQSMICKALTTKQGIKALLGTGFLFVYNLLQFSVSKIIWVLSLILRIKRKGYWNSNISLTQMFRCSNFTTLLHLVLEDLFEGKLLGDLGVDDPLLIILATELSTSSVFYFSRQKSGSWKYGQLAEEKISLAFAVTASAAYPVLLPPLDVTFTFRKNDGTCSKKRVKLTDGGVYDNLGLAPLWPDRDHRFSLNVNEIENIICSRAGYNHRPNTPNQSLLARITSAFICVHTRAQHTSMNRLFDLKKAGSLGGFLLPYLGQDDSRLRFPPVNLVTRDEIDGYPTNFCAMTEKWVNKLSLRGYQLTKALVKEHYPEILSDSLNQNPTTK